MESFKAILDLEKELVKIKEMYRKAVEDDGLSDWLKLHGIKEPTMKTVRDSLQEFMDSGRLFAYPVTFDQQSRLTIEKCNILGHVHGIITDSSNTKVLLSVNALSVYDYRPQHNTPSIDKIAGELCASYEESYPQCLEYPLMNGLFVLPENKPSFKPILEYKGVQLL